MSTLEVRGVRKTYDPDVAPVQALRGVDLTLEQGEFVAVMGPSGTGKSTLLNIVAGLEQPDDGSVRVLGQDLSTLDDRSLAHMRRRDVGIVFQFFNLLDDMTALENVALAALAGGASRKDATKRGRELLDLLGLMEKESALPAALSGGQRQRCAIARSLANEPALLLADEPTGALDSRGGAEVLELFGRLHQRGQAILMVTHNAEVAAAADRCLWMVDGQLTAASREPATP